MGLANRVFNFPKKTEQSVKRKYWWEEVIFPRKFLGVFFHSFMETSNVKRAKVFYNPLLNTVGMHNGLWLINKTRLKLKHFLFFHYKRLYINNNTCSMPYNIITLGHLTIYCISAPLGVAYMYRPLSQCGYLDFTPFKLIIKLNWGRVRNDGFGYSYV